MESNLRPRVCYLVKGKRDYGFHLQGGRKIGGEFIYKVVLGSSADLGGIRPGDRVVEVNGVNVEKDRHHEVVKRVRAIPNRVRLLVVDSDTDEYLRSRGLVCTEDMAVEMGTLLPQISPLSVKPDHLHSFHTTAAGLHLDLAGMESKLRPRLCYLVKEERDYGFHLQGGRKIGGEFIRKVVPGSSADLGGLRPGDRVVEVNGVNVEKDSHHEVVKRVRAIPNRVRLLVVDSDTDEYLRSRGLVCTEDMAIEMGTLLSRPSSRPMPATSSLVRKISPLSVKPDHLHSFHSTAEDLSIDMIIQDKVKRSSLTSCSATDIEVRVDIKTQDFSLWSHWHYKHTQISAVSAQFLLEFKGGKSTHFQDALITWSL
uniref:PDZ domain-containing protein n=1 Tax=Monopterus albus TaxID=43700 RepID=A0A3Q3IXX1_MONAL